MNNKKQIIIRLSVVVIVCLSCLFRIIGIAILAAIPYLLIEKKINKKSFKDIGLSPRSFSGDLKKYWWLIILPVISGVTAVGLSKIIVPEFYQHVLERTQPMLLFDKVFLLIIQLMVLAFIEELVFRAFLQSNISTVIKPAYAIAITSFFFSIGHYSSGAVFVVLYDLVFIFIDSLLYGMIFQKTKSVYSCAFSHFIANAVGVFILLIM